MSTRPPPGLLLGFHGPASAGKDTCAQLLADHGFRAVAFGDALRAEIAEAWRIDSRMLTDRATKEWPIEALAIGRCADAAFVRGYPAEALEEPRSPRWVMQQWGTEYRRAGFAHYWVEQVHRWVLARRAEGHHRLCITDVRFPNEAALVAHLGGHVLRVHRPSLPVAAAVHASEQVLPCNEVVHNDGDLEHLRAELLRVVYRLAPAVALPWFPPQEAA